ncbi:MAG: type II secretion system protein GspD [Armatimonadetes bacterium]|nr:type II secretion system protein GspD [Armatimonadota bacterium]
MNKHRIVVAAALVGLVAPAYAQKASIQGVEVKTTDTARQLWIQGTDVSKPRIIWANRHSSYILEFYARLAGRKSDIDVNADGIKNVQTVWYTSRPPRVRVAVRTDGNVEPTLTFIDGSWVVSVPTQGNTTPTATPAPVAPRKIETELKKPTAPPVNLSAEAQLTGAAKPWSLQEAMRLTLNDKTTKTSTENVVIKDPVRLQQHVSLDFVGTDVVQILKALAIQTSENIVVSPDVSPADKPLKLTVSLNKVSLDDALSFVTAMAGLRYARVGSTYIVTPSQNFSQAMRMVVDRTNNKFETRVVNLVSGSAAQIRDAALKAIPAEGKNGYYEIIVPGTGDIPVAPMAAQPADPKAAPAAAQTAAKASKTYYLMVVGDPQRVEEVEGYIHELDKQIAASSSLSKSEDLGTSVINIQSGSTDRIKATLEKMIADDPRVGEFSVSESTVDDNIPGVPGTKVLMLVGPKSALNTLTLVANTLDQELCRVSSKTYVADAGKLMKEDEIIELQFVEPTVALAQVRQRFPNISVWTFAQPVTPGASGSVSSTQSSGGGAAGGGGSTGQASGGSSSSTQSQSVNGLEPMKLIVRGQRSVIDEVKAFVSKIDVAPKQVALELRVLELTKEDALKLGLDWSILDPGKATVFRMNQGAGTTSSSGGTISGAFPYKDDYSHSVLGTLDQLGGSNKMIARPNALISDGRSTNLFVGDTVRYIKTITQSQNGTTVVSDELKVGVKFDINARIGSGGAIALGLDQNFSILTGFTPVPGGGNLPQTSDRTTNMFVNMQSGETIAIGGLIQDQDRKSVSGIPFLKDLPIIGMFFSRTDNRRVRTEIVFFLTANVVDPSNRAHAASPRTGLKNSPDPVKEYFGSDADKKGGK